jgi:ribosomal-protein-alanine N-acetyltransferase
MLTHEARGRTAVPNETVSALPFVVRPMQMADIPAVMAIERQSFPSPWPESAFCYELRYRKDSRFYVLELRAEVPPTGRVRLREMLQRQEQPLLLGYMGVRSQGSDAHICTIAVHPGWRGRGLGLFLLLMALEEAVQHRARQVVLEVRPSNTIAQRLYEKAGFARAGVCPAYYRDGEDAWVMVLAPLDEARKDRLRGLREAAQSRLMAGLSGHGGR